MQILEDIIPEIEHYSIDEAFMDLSHLPPNETEKFAKRIINRLMQYVSIPVSIGIGHTKTLAKLANSIAKKQKTLKVCSILNEEERIKLLKQTNIQEIWGIGREYSKFLLNNHIFTAFNLSIANDSWIRKHMSVIGLKIVHELRGHVCLELENKIQDKKSITFSRSFGEYISNFEELKEPLIIFVSKAAEKLRKNDLTAQAIGVTIKTNKYNRDHYYSNYGLINLIEPTNYTPDLIANATHILSTIYQDIIIKNWELFYLISDKNKVNRVVCLIIQKMIKRKNL